MEQSPASPEELAVIERRIDEWLAAGAAANPVIDAVERGEDDHIRWFVRVLGEDKDVWTAWWTLGQRTLRCETFLMPAPEENHAAVFEHLLRRNASLTGLHLEIGDEDAIFLRGSIPVRWIDDESLDTMLGSMYAAVELVFRPALRLAFASRFGR